MFYHGRESYRKNSFVINYTFYKNILYITTQYFNGWFSVFSGQPLYENVMYQTYNFCMTSVPLMWYGIYDQEHDHKKKFELENG